MEKSKTNEQVFFIFDDWSRMKVDQFEVDCAYHEK